MVKVPNCCLHQFIYIVIDIYSQQCCDIIIYYKTDGYHLLCNKQKIDKKGIPSSEKHTIEQENAPRHASKRPNKPIRLIETNQIWHVHQSLLWAGLKEKLVVSVLHIVIFQQSVKCMMSSHDSHTTRARYVATNHRQSR
jgi:hypothetical protein